MIPKVGQRVSMQQPICIGWGRGWIPAVVTRVAIVPTANVGDVVIIAASGIDQLGGVIGPHVTSFLDSGHFCVEVDGWCIGDACEVRLGGVRWIPGVIAEVAPHGVRVDVPSEGMTVPRSTKTDAECFRRPGGA